MNNKIKQLAKQLQIQKDLMNNKINDIKEKLQKELDAIWKNDSNIKEAIKKLEQSTDFGADECNEIYTWTRFELEPYKKYQEYFENFLMEYYGAYAKFEHDALILFQGECIIINEEGDIFLDDKRIIDAKDYSNETERNELIEKYMNDSGYFPSVLYQGHYGDLSLVNTQNK